MFRLLIGRGEKEKDRVGSFLILLLLLSSFHQGPFHPSLLNSTGDTPEEIRRNSMWIGETQEIQHIGNPDKRRESFVKRALMYS